jgi:hypothetical protein
MHNAATPPPTVEGKKTRPRSPTIWLWGKQAVGYALAGALLTLLVLLTLAIVAMAVVEMSLSGAAVFGILFTVSLGMVVWYLGELKG